MLTRRHLIYIAALGLSGCSYRPLYSGGTDAGVAAELSGIAIDEQRTRVGQLLRNELLSTMSPPGSAREATYRLKLVVTERDVYVSTLPNEPVSRRRLAISARYELVGLANGKLASKGSSQASVGYDTVRQPVSDLQARNAAMQRAAVDVAQDIRMRLSAHFVRS